MAVTLSSQPSKSVLWASEKLCFGLTLTDAGTDPITNEIAYRLKCVDSGEWLTPLVTAQASSGETVSLDFMSDVTCRLRTKIPSIVLGGQPDDTFKKDVQLFYGCAEFNSDDCEQNTVDITQSSNTFTVVNGYCQDWEEQTVVTNQPLTNFPRHIKQCEGTFDWAWVCGSISIEYEIYYKDGSAITSAPATYNDGCFPIGVGNIPNTENATCIKILIARDVVSTITVVPCCCDEDCREDLYFLDSKGSWRCIGDFKCVDSKGVKREGSVICTQSDCNKSLEETLKYFGNTYMRKKGWNRVTLKKKVVVSCDDENFYNAFSQSGIYAVRKGNVMMGFIAESISDYKKSNDVTEITVTGYYSAEYKSHTSN